MNYNSATEDKSYYHAWVGFIFNAYMDGGAETNKIERRKIYKTEETIWNFNQNKEKKIKIFTSSCVSLYNNNREKKINYKPLNNYRFDLIMTSVHCLVFYSYLESIRWVYLVYEPKNWNKKDEIDIALMKDYWYIYILFKEDRKYKILVGFKTDNISKVLQDYKDVEFLNKASSLTVLYWKQLIDILVDWWTKCYKENEWEDIYIKWSKKAQQPIANFLDLHCGGLGCNLPPFWDIWENKKLKDELDSCKKSDEDWEKYFLKESQLKEDILKIDRDFYKKIKEKNMGETFDILYLGLCSFRK